MNTVLQVYSTAGAPLTGVQDLNTFLGYPAQINRCGGTRASLGNWATRISMLTP